MKDLEDKKQEFYDKFVVQEPGVENYIAVADQVWQWIEAQLAEAERRGAFDYACWVADKSEDHRLYKKYYKEFEQKAFSQPEQS